MGSANRERPLLLVVEDRADDREIYGRILGYNGFDVVFAEDGIKGLRLAKDIIPDVILLDVGLPGMSGLDLCSRLKLHPESADIPVIALTAFPESELGPDARRLGCAAYIEKPASPVDVLHKIEELTGRPPAAGVGRPPRIGTT